MNTAETKTETKEPVQKKNIREKAAAVTDRVKKLWLYRMLFEKRIIFFILSFITPAAIMTYAFAQNSIHPFGDQQMLVVDLWHQYYPFFTVVREKLLTHGSFLYSWENGLGTNFISLISYYAASPLNWLSIFFNAEHVRDALTFILILKIGFAGMFFSMFLSYVYKRRDLSLVIFAVMFALSSYTLGYYWNVMWFDTIALFPLVMLGIVAIARDGKWKVYTIALALSLAANYYIAFFTCIFSVFMFAAAGIIEFKGIKDYLYKVWLIVRSSVIGLGLAAFMLLPAYFGLKLTYSANNTFPKETTWYEKWTDILANTISYNAPVKVEGLPNIACGMLAVVLFGVFLFSFGIKIREKVSVLAMLAIIIVSCNMNKLNYIWHGFHFTNQIPYRFAFIFCFVLVAAAFRAYDIMLSKGINIYQLFLMLIAPAAVFYFNYKKLGVKGIQLLSLGAADPSATNKQVFTLLMLAQALVILVPVAAGIALISFICKKKKVRKSAAAIVTVIPAIFGIIGVIINMAPAVSVRNNMESMPTETTQTATDKVYEVIFGISEAFDKSLFITFAFLLIFAAAKSFPFRSKKVRGAVMNIAVAAIVFSEFITNAQLGVETVSTTSYDNYPLAYDECEALLDSVDKSDTTPFYRTEMNATWTLNDSALYGYYGLSQFSSSANVSVTRLSKRLGLYASEAGNRYFYRTSTPVVNALFGIKYLIKRSGPLNSEAGFIEEYGKSGNSYLYKNNYPLSLGFMMNEDILTMKDEDAYNPFEYQNQLIRLATGSEEDIFIPQPVALAEYDNMTVQKNGFGNYNYHVTDPEKKASATYSYDGIDGSTLYGFAGYNGASTCDDLTIKCSGVTVDSGGLVKDFGIVFPMGNSKSGTTSTVQITAKDERTSGDFKMMIYAMNNEGFKNAYNALADEQLNITQFSDARIKGTITANSDGVLYLSMPYEKGWHVYVDGKEVPTCKVMQAMMGAKIKAGKHDIELRYSPEGFVPGLIISISALLLMILCIVLERYFRKRRAEKAEAERLALIAAAVPTPEELAASSVIYDQGSESDDAEHDEKTEETEAAGDEKPQSDSSIQGN